ncbi:MAG: TonB-dependent receptor plug domain-containing protein, partial [Proteobacteria bacterium]|nr:TonB-dependent receptor plug domain-containing protein [Pseudomonadota bacterium]
MKSTRIGISHLLPNASFLRLILRRGSILLLAAGLAPFGALAQDSDGEVIEEIFVTGSRIARSDLSAPSPTVVVSEEFIKTSGNVTLEQTLNQMPQLRPNGTSTANVTGGAGILAADLRGLGRNRSLMLVNGKRFAPANSAGLSDMASIPTALVERIEVITGGASAVYGSDAIAGAVNFILKRDFEGLEFDYQYGQTGEGDGNTNKLAITLGGNFADGRGNAVLHTSYTDRDEIKFGSRDFSFYSVDPNSAGVLVPTGSSNIPGRLIGLGGTTVAGLQNIDLNDFTSSTQYANDGSGACDNGGNITAIRFGDGGLPLPFCTPQHRYNVNPVNLLQRPLERVLINGMAHYDIKDNVRFYVSADFMSNQQAFQRAEASFTARTPGQDN